MNSRNYSEKNSEEHRRELLTLCQVYNPVKIEVLENVGEKQDIISKKEL